MRYTWQLTKQNAESSANHLNIDILDTGVRPLAYKSGAFERDGNQGKCSYD